MYYNLTLDFDSRTTFFSHLLPSIVLVWLLGSTCMLKLTAGIQGNASFSSVYSFVFIVRGLCYAWTDVHPIPASESFSRMKLIRGRVSSMGLVGGQSVGLKVVLLLRFEFSKYKQFLSGLCSLGIVCKVGFIWFVWFGDVRGSDLSVC